MKVCTRGTQNTTLPPIYSMRVYTFYINLCTRYDSLSLYSTSALLTSNLSHTRYFTTCYKYTMCVCTYIAYHARRVINGYYTLSCASLLVLASASKTTPRTLTFGSRFRFVIQSLIELKTITNNYLA